MQQRRLCLSSMVSCSDQPLHTGASNFLLADGHVKELRPIAVSPGHNAADANTDQTAVGNSGGNAAGTNVAQSTHGAYTSTFSVK